MLSPTSTLLRLALLTGWLAGCATGPTSDPAAGNACQAIVLPPRLDDGRRAELAREIEAQPGAVWVGVLEESARIERDVRACQGVRG